MTPSATETAASESPTTGGAIGVAVGALFFFSGALGLLYEIVWFRRLHLALGVSIVAVGAVTAAFMLGLAAGSRWAAESPRVRSAPLSTYAALEIGVALYALAFPILVGGIEALYPHLFHLLGAAPLILSLVRFLLAFVLLLPPTFLMGASLPAVSQAATQWTSPTGIARRVAGLYALNTVGGVVGTLVAGFLALEHLGIRRSLLAGAVGSATVALLALLLSRHPAFRAPRPVPEGVPPRRRPHEAAAPRLAGLAVSAALLAGLASLASEIVWTRALVFFVHNSTYAFSAILALYLLGIAAGSVIATRFVRDPRAAVRFLAFALGAGSLSLLLAIATYRQLPELAAFLAGSRESVSLSAGGSPAGTLLLASWGRALVVIFGQVGAVLLAPSLLLGAVFPTTLKLVEGEGQAPARLVGRLYAVNTLGSLVGVLLGTFVLVAALGTRLALLVLAWLPLPVALWALWRSGLGKGAVRLLAALLVAVMAGGSLAAAPRDFYRDLFQQRFGRVVWFSEGVAETVAVCDYPDGSRWIQYSDGRGASGTWSYQGGWLYAHLPLLLHPRPRSAAVVCFGTGNTLGAASLHPLERLDGIELSREVLKAAPFFAQTNHDVARNPQVRLVIEDGRNYLLATDRRYDVISEEPPLVHTAGVVNLYSRDFYQLCARRLTDDGIMAVWLATWELESSELRMLVRAFVDVFPYASVWDCTHPYEWLLIGSKTAPAIDLDLLATRMREPRLAHDLARIDPEHGGLRTPADLLSLHLQGREALAAFAGEIDPVTDDRSVVDFTTPRRARANFGLGEWVTGGLRAVGVGGTGLSAETRLRDFDRIYVFRESALPLVARYGAHEPARFAEEVAERTRARERRAAEMTLAIVRRLAGDLRARGQLSQGLEVVERARALVPPAEQAPLRAMEAQLREELAGKGIPSR